MGDRRLDPRQRRTAGRHAAGQVAVGEPRFWVGRISVAYPAPLPFGRASADYGLRPNPPYRPSNENARDERAFLAFTRPVALRARVIPGDHLNLRAGDTNVGQLAVVETSKLTH